MIHAVRLRPYNKKAGNKMKTYLSGYSRTKYKVGEAGQPSPIKVVTAQAELHELREFAQFEIIPFNNRSDLDTFVTRETLTAARRGQSVVKPVITVGAIQPDSEDNDDDAPSVDSIFEGEEDPEAELEALLESDKQAQEQEKVISSLTPPAGNAKKNTGRKASKPKDKSKKAKSSGKKKPS